MAKQDIDHDETPDELALRTGAPAPTQAAEPELEDEPQAAAAPAAEAAPAAPAAEPAAVEAEPVAKDEAAAEDEPFVPKFEGVVPEDYETSRKALRDEKAALRSKWSAGELDDTEFNAQEAAIDDKIDGLREQYLTAKALQEANAQIQRQQAQRVVEAIRVQGVAAGIDYGTPDKPGPAARQFDRALQVLADDAEWKTKGFEALVAEAHRTVMALNGKVAAAATLAPAPAAAAPAPAAAAAPKQAAPRDIPPTLGAMPPAAAPAIGNDLLTQIGSMDPDEAEAMVERLPQAQRSALLRSTFAAGRT